MSAQHIYHTALPLSPKTSALRLQFFESCPSWEEDWTTQQAPSSSLPATWGGILRTIEADSGRFTHVTTVGKSIAAVCEDNTINVYDAVTGVLKLSVNAPRQATKVESSSDGSILFCAHRRSREITLWDMQTGGSINTFTTEFDIWDIAVSLTGKYLASCSSDGAFVFWEVGSRCGGSHFMGEPVASICWLEPENQVALALKETVVVLEVTTGRTLHTFPVGKSVWGIAYSAIQHRLAVWLTSRIGSTIVIIDVRTRSTLVSSPPPTRVSCFAFDSDGDRVVCATETGHLLFFRISVSPISWHEYPNHLGTIHSICHLPSGHLVAGLSNGIQLLVTESTQAFGTSQDSGVSHVYPLDNGRAICAPSVDRKIVNLLDMGAVETLARYDVEPRVIGSSHMPRILCASIDEGIAALYFQNSDGFTLRLVGIGSTFPERDQRLLGPPISAALSPDGDRLIVIVDRGFTFIEKWELWLWRDLRPGAHGTYLCLYAQAGRPPGNVIFASETGFYTEDRCPLVSSAPPSGEGKDEVHHKDCYVRKNFKLEPGMDPDHISKLWEEEVLPAHPYALDENMEWVVDARSRRVCWLPPGYLSGVANGHFFGGSSIVMAGKDGILRKLSFREPCSDS